MTALQPLPPEQACPCGNHQPYQACCGLCHSGEQPAVTAEALMRSRYSAHACVDSDYLMATWAKEIRAQVNRNDVESWARDSEWLRLDIVKTEAGQPNDHEGWVTFKAYYRQQGVLQLHGERSYFRKEHGHWFFVDGESLPSAQTKIGRNDECPCGSGKKVKRCCG